MEHILKSHDIVKTNFVRGKNCYLYDDEGKRYVDFESGIWCTALGHGHPRINRAMEAQINKIVHLGTRYPHSLAETAAKDILNITGICQGKCVFLSSGSEAVEFGVQVARQISKKPLLLTLYSSYLGAYGSAGKKKADEWILFDYGDSCDVNSPNLLGKIPWGAVGGFVLEPGGSGSGFVKFPPKKLVEEITNQIRQDAGLLVANEITTGMGRTGKWFGFQHYNVKPDIVALGKGIGNGYPVSAVAMTQDIAKELERHGFKYAQSHQNDPLGCSVALEVIATLREDNLIERGKLIGNYFLEQLLLLKKKYDLIIKEARGRGLLLALEFHPHESITVTWMYHELLKQGFLVGYYQAGNILRFDPGLMIDREDINQLVKCLDSILGEAS